VPADKNEFARKGRWNGAEFSSVRSGRGVLWLRESIKAGSSSTYLPHLCIRGTETCFRAMQIHQRIRPLCRIDEPQSCRKELPLLQAENMVAFYLANRSRTIFRREKYQPKRHPIRLFAANAELPIHQIEVIRSLRQAALLGIVFLSDLFVGAPTHFGNRIVQLAIVIFLP